MVLVLCAALPKLAATSHALYCVLRFCWRAIAGSSKRPYLRSGQPKLVIAVGSKAGFVPLLIVKDLWQLPVSHREPDSDLFLAAEWH